MGSKKDDEIRETMPLAEETIDAIQATRQRDRRASLLVYHRDGAKIVSLRPNEPITVGRESPAHVRIEEPGLSREHARFSLADGAVVVEDLGSRNGTWVAGRRIARRSPSVVGPGDEILMGGVRAFVHILSPTDGELLGLSSHERFRLALEDEVARARYFGRPGSVLLVRAARHPASHVSRWGARLLSLLRPIDRAALYSPEAMEILLSEAGSHAATELARTIVTGRADGDPPLLVGVALFPDAATDAESLIELSVSAAQGATPEHPVQLAEAGAWMHGEQSPKGPSGEAPVVASPAMKKVFETVRRIAGVPITVLIQGETGVGKEIIARAIHAASPRRSRPIVCVNCGAIPAQLVESTLYGHMKGAFTGAVQDQKGVFEAAEGGTVLLDEIGELPPAVQVALLRVLETRQVIRVGSTKEIDVDVRVIAATNRDLEAMVVKGAFREDLFYRLSAMPITIPPLRERVSEIEPLSMRFLDQTNRLNGSHVAGFAPSALSLMQSYSWPGNVRELRNAVERAVAIASSDRITEEDLPERVRAAARAGVSSRSGPSGVEVKRGSAKPSAGGGAGVPVGKLKTSVELYEKELIMAALAAAGGQAQAAKLLDIPLRTLAHKIRKYAIKKRGYGVE